MYQFSFRKVPLGRKTEKKTDYNQKNQSLLQTIYQGYAVYAVDANKINKIGFALFHVIGEKMPVEISTLSLRPSRRAGG